ncbi:hypothetical protein L3X38_016251 [Prunus dulcis]|uniref:Uncharacterized protein n=1 Tax=Prunus dulcis TaxID=3755 RepID=A0AAD4Z816_PRUDU|nr:hypothetical protein L3X38_016251 [Prunus dulcis]
MFLRVLQGLGHLSWKFGPDQTVRSLTIARSDGYYKPSPRVGIFGISTSTVDGDGGDQSGKDEGEVGVRTGPVSRPVVDCGDGDSLGGWQL